MPDARARVSFVVLRQRQFLRVLKRKIVGVPERPFVGVPERPFVGVPERPFVVIPQRSGGICVCLCLSFLLSATTLQAQRPALTCAVIQAPFDYTTVDLHGPRAAFDLELCHAVAAALGPATKVVPVELPDEASAVAALRSAKVDMAPTVSADLTHSTDPGIALGPKILMDAVGLLAAKAVPSAAALAGGKICFFSGTETETSLHTWFRLHALDFLPYPFSEEGEMQAAFSSGTCPAIAGDATRLAAVRASMAHPDAYRILPEVLAPDPLASATRRNDTALTRVVFAVEQLLLNAETLGVSRENLVAAEHSGDPAIERLLGKTHELGPAAGLDDGWPLRVLQAVGNYGEVMHRALPLILPVPPAAALK